MTLLTAARIVRKVGAEYSIRMLVGNLHVGTPEATVAADWRERTRKAFAKKGKHAPQGDAAILGPDVTSEAVVLFALAVHRHNRRIYRRVMRGF